MSMLIDTAHRFFPVPMLRWLTIVSEGVLSFKPSSPPGKRGTLDPLALRGPSALSCPWSERPLTSGRPATTRWGSIRTEDVKRLLTAADKQINVAHNWWTCEWAHSAKNFFSFKTGILVRSYRRGETQQLPLNSAERCTAKASNTNSTHSIYIYHEINLERLIMMRKVSPWIVQHWSIRGVEYITSVHMINVANSE